MAAIMRPVFINHFHIRVRPFDHIQYHTHPVRKCSEYLLVSEQIWCAKRGYHAAKRPVDAGIYSSEGARSHPQGCFCAVLEADTSSNGEAC